VEVWDKYQEPPYEILLEKAKEVDAMVTLVSDNIDCNLLKQAKNLRIIAQYAVGYNNIDIDCATKLGIYVTNTPGVLTDATAELAWALLMAAARNIAVADHFVRFGEWWRLKTAWHPKMLLGFGLKGKTLGIIGFGRIGQAVARRARGFGMRVIYYDIYRNEKAEKELGAEFKPLEELLKESDFVSIHVPLTKETYHLIGEKELKMMKPTAILINTARGPIVDTNALVKALKEGWIAGAGLDVFDQEPLPLDHPLLELDNVTLTPHLGANTIDCRIRLAVTAAEEVLRVLHGEKPKYPVNPEVVENIKRKQE